MNNPKNTIILLAVVAVVLGILYFMDALPKYKDTILTIWILLLCWLVISVIKLWKKKKQLFH